VPWQTIAELTVWAAVGALLASVLIDDLANYRVRNTTVLMLACLFVVYCLIKDNLSLFVGHLTIAAVMFVVLAAAYGLGMMGGGDLKLLTIAFLWLGLENGFLFCLLLCAASVVYIGSAWLNWLPSRKLDKRTQVPFGPSIAVAWVTTMLLTELPRALA